ncbi:MAG: orotate phosphoribosyltransferase, partial [Chloroflexi bacterium]|nr:orotate phosphoribosyltransferase [Chloroflexota bacterium]
VAAAYLKGNFVLSSGRHSNYYFDKYLFETNPSILKRLGRYLGELVPPETQCLAAPELGAVLLGAAVSMELGLPLVLVRKDTKDYGTSRLLEGPELNKGERVTVIEDILTSGGQAIRAAQKVREAGGRVLRLVAVVDREEGAAAAMAAAELPYEPLFRKSDLNLPE